MTRPHIWWDEEERFARRAAAVFVCIVVLAVLIPAGLGVVTGDQTLLLGALQILAVGVGAVVAWVAIAVPVMLMLVAMVATLSPSMPIQVDVASPTS
jgi:hypothetical protein